jgi:hypothetical protein
MEYVKKLEKQIDELQEKLAAYQHLIYVGCQVLDENRLTLFLKTGKITSLLGTLIIHKDSFEISFNSRVTGSSILFNNSKNLNELIENIKIHFGLKGLEIELDKNVMEKLKK